MKQFIYTSVLVCMVFIINSCNYKEVSGQYLKKSFMWQGKEREYLMDILPNVSVLIPTYNRRNFLGLCLDNIMKQSYPKNKLEIVIIDDGEEKLIIDEIKIRKLLFPIKLKYIKINYKNKLKIGEKRNYLVQYATYDHLINMDDDDIYLNNYILKSILYLLMKNVGLVGSNQMVFYFYR